MLRRNRITAATFGLTLSFGGALAEETQQPTLESQPKSDARKQAGAPQSNKAPQQQPPIPDHLLPALKGIEAAIRDLIAKEHKIAGERQEKREIDDLRAQQDMAVWAKGMFWATVATVFLTFAALVAIIRTLHHTRRAADYSQAMATQAEASTKAAEASVAEAQNSVAISDTSFKVTQRPFVFPETFLWQRIVLGTREPAYMVRPLWRNNGHTFTVGLMTATNFVIMDEEMPADFSFPPLSDKPATLFPGATTQGPAVILPISLIMARAMQQKFIYVYGRAIYRDSFTGTEEHITRFCRIVDTDYGDLPFNDIVQMHFTINSQHEDGT